MRKNQGECHAVQRVSLHGDVEVLGQCSLACFDQVRKTFKRLKKEGFKIDPNILQHIPSEEVAVNLLELMDQKFPLEEVKVAYKAVWGLDGQEENVDETLCWEDALLPSTSRIERNHYLQCRLDPALNDRAISVNTFKNSEIFLLDVPEFLLSQNNNDFSYSDTVEDGDTFPPSLRI